MYLHSPHAERAAGRHRRDKERGEAVGQFFFMDISFLLLIVSSLYTLSFRFGVHEGGLHLEGKLWNVRLYEQVVERTVASITLLPVR